TRRHRFAADLARRVGADLGRDQGTVCEVIGRRADRLRPRIRKSRAAAGANAVGRGLDRQPVPAKSVPAKSALSNWVLAKSRTIASPGRSITRPSNGARWVRFGAIGEPFARRSGQTMGLPRERNPR